MIHVIVLGYALVHASYFVQLVTHVDCRCIPIDSLSIISLNLVAGKRLLSEASSSLSGFVSFPVSS